MCLIKMLILTKYGNFTKWKLVSYDFLNIKTMTCLHVHINERN